MAKLIERRKLPRIDVRWPVKMIRGNESIKGEARNITVEGVFVFCSQKLTLNETYRLLIKSNEDEIEVMGKVVWSTFDDLENRNLLPGVGFCFVKVSDENRQRLREAIRKYAEV